MIVVGTDPDWPPAKAFLLDFETQRLVEAAREFAGDWLDGPQANALDPEFVIASERFYRRLREQSGMQAGDESNGQAARQRAEAIARACLAGTVRTSANWRSRRPAGAA